MSQDSKKIAEEIVEIAHKWQHALRFPVMSGMVVAGSYDSDAMTVSVELSVDDASAPTPDIMLNVMLNNMGGIYMLPADGAKCIVAEIDGPGKWELLKASKYDKVYIKADTLVQINDGSKGGIPVVGKVDDNLNTLKTYLKDTLEPQIKDAINAVGVGSAADGPTAATAFGVAMAAETITFEDMENKNVTHG